MIPKVVDVLDKVHCGQHRHSGRLRLSPNIANVRRKPHVRYPRATPGWRGRGCCGHVFAHRGRPLIRSTSAQVPHAQLHIAPGVVDSLRELLVSALHVFGAATVVDANRVDVPARKRLHVDVLHAQGTWLAAAIVGPRVRVCSNAVLEARARQPAQREETLHSHTLSCMPLPWR